MKRNVIADTCEIGKYENFLFRTHHQERANTKCDIPIKIEQSYIIDKQPSLFL